MVFFEWLGQNYISVLTVLAAFLTGVLGILYLIPGNQGESVIAKILSILNKFLENKKEEKK
jgi:hypothetical protein